MKEKRGDKDAKKEMKVRKMWTIVTIVSAVSLEDENLRVKSTKSVVNGFLSMQFPAYNLFYSISAKTIVFAAKWYL